MLQHYIEEPYVGDNVWASKIISEYYLVVKRMT